jgi:hypothetical protein
LPCWAFFRDSVFIYFGEKEKILTVDEKTTRDTSRSVTKTVFNNIDIHLRNAEGNTPEDFKSVNGAPNLTHSTNMFL